MTWKPISEEDVDELIDSPKTSNEKISWEEKQNTNFLKAEIEINNSYKADLRFIITLNREDYSKYSCVLLLNNIRVRGLCIKGNHNNKCIDKNKWRGKTHKHKWTDKCSEGWAYTPNDIDESTIENAIYSFLKECNIKFRGQFGKIPPMVTTLRRS